MSGLRVQLYGTTPKLLPDSLRIHLARDRHTRTNGKVAWVSAPAQDGFLGDGLDVLTLIITSVLALPGTIAVIKSWVDSCGTDVRVVIGETSATIKGAQTTEEYEAIIEALKAAASSMSGNSNPGNPSP